MTNPEQNEEIQRLQQQTEIIRAVNEYRRARYQENPLTKWVFETAPYFGVVLVAIAVLVSAYVFVYLIFSTLRQAPCTEKAGVSNAAVVKVEPVTIAVAPPPT